MSTRIQQTAAYNTWPLYDYPLDPTRDLDRSVALIDEMEPFDDRTRANLDRALSAIDRISLGELLTRHADRFEKLDPVAQFKYADLAIWAYRMLVLAQTLDLDRKPPLRILDIGMGSGAFSRVAESMGHTVVGTDMANDWYAELCELHGAKRVEAPVVRGEPYRIDGGPFDLITIIQPTFHRRSRKDKTRDYWSNEDWGAFLSDIGTNLLADGGEICLLMPLDKTAEGDLTVSPLLDWLEARGATLGTVMPDGREDVIRLDAQTVRGLAQPA